MRAQENNVDVMKIKLLLAGVVAAASITTGCVTYPPGAERGPRGTMAYMVPVEASEQGVVIYADGKKAGTAPLTLKIFGDRDGTFHNFGSYQFVVQAVPLKTNQFVQTRVFRSGRVFRSDDRIPDRIHFDMSQPPLPEELYVPSYPPPAYYYGPPAYYYGPSFYFGPSYYQHHGYYHHRGLHIHRR